MSFACPSSRISPRCDLSLGIIVWPELMISNVVEYKRKMYKEATQAVSALVVTSLLWCASAAGRGLVTAPAPPPSQVSPYQLCYEYLVPAGLSAALDGYNDVGKRCGGDWRVIS